MPSFLENWLNRNYDLRSEIMKIQTLFTEKNNFSWSILQVVDTHFLEWIHRNNAITLEDFLNLSGIHYIYESIVDNEVTTIDMSSVVLYLEYAVNILAFFSSLNHSYANYEIAVRNARAIKQNISSIIEKIGYAQIRQDNGILNIVIKDAVADMASDIVEGKYKLDEAIFMYRHHSMDGNIVGKAGILARMEKYCEGEIEPFINGNAVLKKVKDDIGFMVNQLDIRHAPRDKIKPAIEELKASGELETWYDELYRQIISLIVLYDCSKKQKDIEELKERLGLRTQSSRN